MVNKALLFISLTPLLYGEVYTYSQAEEFCKNNNEHLPSYHELLHVVSSLPEGIYWTSTQLANSTTDFFAISANKETNSYDSNEKFSVSCIKSQEKLSVSPFYSQNLTTLDKKTSLLWERKTPHTKKERYTFDKAIQYCENLQINGGGWHLPTLEELSTIVNPSKVAPSTFEPFNDTIFKYYWTSTNSTVPFSNEAYVIGFRIGSIALSQKVNESFVRCVKKGK